jgi:hypothetical protein
MKHFILIAAMLAMLPGFAIAADTATNPPAKPARSAVDSAKVAEHAKADIKRHRTMAAAHEAAAEMPGIGKDEDFAWPSSPRRAKASPTASTVA